jgi:predicted RNase H-like nuclease (RuvC/YqgF family)
MMELMGRLLNLVRDPTVVVTVVTAALILLVMRRFYEQQHAFLKEQMDYLRRSYDEQHSFLSERLGLLRQENEAFRHRVEELTAQMKLVQEENQRLKSLTATFTALARQIQESPSLSDALVRELRQFSELTASIQHSGFARLEAALRDRAADREVIAIVHELVEAIGDSQSATAQRLRALETRTRGLAER